MKNLFLLLALIFCLGLKAQDSLEITIKKIQVYESYRNFKTFKNKHHYDLKEGQFKVFENDELLSTKKFKKGDISVKFPIKPHRQYMIVIQGKSCITDVEIIVNSNNYNCSGTKTIGIGHINPLKYIAAVPSTPNMIKQNDHQIHYDQDKISELNAYYEFEYFSLEKRFLQSSSGLGKVIVNVKEGISDIFTSNEDSVELEEVSIASEEKDTSNNQQSRLKESIKAFFFTKPTKTNSASDNDSTDKEAKSSLSDDPEITLTSDRFYKRLKTDLNQEKSIYILEEIDSEEDLAKKQMDIQQKRKELKKQISSAKSYEDSLKILEYEMSLESAEKTLELIRNELENQKKITELNKKMLLDQKELVKAEKRKKQLLYGGLSVSGFLTILVTYFLAKSRNLNKRVKRHVVELQEFNEEIRSQRDKIENQKTLIEEKNLAITESINYARRIQRAILPSDEEMKQALKNYFVVYKPKDIVAGDFYWMEQIGDATLVAVADCTGHGVPGSLVSIVCYNALNRAVREFGLSTPAHILDKTRELVIETFKAQHEEIKDGMDISLLSINKNKKCIEWSGANNPLYLLTNKTMEDLNQKVTTSTSIRTNDYSLTKIKANKQPIGYTHSIEPFTNHTLNFDDVKQLYLFTDGFPDQFGGPNDKKFGYKRFRETLLKLSDKPIYKQGPALEKILDEWMSVGKDRQIDDVCILGIMIP